MPTLKTATAYSADAPTNEGDGIPWQDLLAAKGSPDGGPAETSDIIGPNAFFTYTKFLRGANFAAGLKAAGLRPGSTLVYVQPLAVCNLSADPSGDTVAVFQTLESGNVIEPELYATSGNVPDNLREVYTEDANPANYTPEQLLQDKMQVEVQIIAPSDDVSAYVDAIGLRVSFYPPKGMKPVALCRRRGIAERMRGRK